MRDPSGHTSLPSFVAVALILREISATSGSFYRVTEQIHGPVSVHSATLSPKTMALRRVLELGACVTNRDTQICQVSSPKNTYSERKVRLQAPIMGLRGPNTGQLVHIRRHFHR
ncbi:hypothetical protein DPMN_186619 [Dreissena polymorpha]|uniref:Secreted protein n=1 Tax=Dreissena polymorpha TaxID=45954 RepID=A0A9D4DNL4_DREPO|nr:hypothetical protein DPMN_186619 [Dreissena polymorpha]